MTEAGYDMDAERGKRKELTEEELKKLKEEEYKRMYGLTIKDKLDKIIDLLNELILITKGY